MLILLVWIIDSDLDVTDVQLAINAEIRPQRNIVTIKMFVYMPMYHMLCNIANTYMYTH